MKETGFFYQGEKGKEQHIHVRQSAKLPPQSSLQRTQRIRRRIARHDARLRQPSPRRQRAEIAQRRRVKVDDVGVRDVLRAVARHVKGREARGVFAEFVRPQRRVGRSLRYPEPRLSIYQLAFRSLALGYGFILYGEKKRGAEVLVHISQ